MRLIVARCEVSYSGRLNAFLPESTRLLMLKDDGSVLVHADANDKQSPEKALLDRSVSDDVQRALDALPDDFRTAVVLCDVNGLSYKEIAEIMDCPVGTVMSRLFRGRKLLATALREFAQAEGYVRQPPQKVESVAATIDLEKYRAQRRGEGSK